MAVISNIEDVQSFINNLSGEEDLDRLKKDELKLVAEYLDLDIRSSDKKQDIKLAVKERLGLSKEGETEEVSKSGNEIEILKLKLAFKELEERDKERTCREREKERVFIENEKQKEREDREREREDRERQRAHELQLAQLRNGGSGDSDESNHFDILKHIKLVPKFNECDVGKFFMSFEKVANQLKWPSDQWTIMLQVVLTGKAQAAYSALSVEDSNNYETVKEVILRAYELVPEAYRQKFRNLRKQPNETYIEFARSKERLFLEWCESRKVKTLAELKELMLIEEFKNCLHKELRTHLEETQVKLLEEAAKVADEYHLTHKVSYFPEPRKQFIPKVRSPPRNHNYPSTFASSAYRRWSPPQFRSNITCYKCGKQGHVQSKCFLIKNMNPVKKTMLIKKSCDVHSHNSEFNSQPTSKAVIQDFGPYISQANVKFCNSDISSNVTVLRDTGASQSLLLRSSAPSEIVVTDSKQVWLGGFPNSIVSCPLLTVNLQSKFGNGEVEVAVVDHIPIEGIQFVLGNDIAHKKMIDNPVIISNPKVLSDDIPVNFVDEVCPITAITRSKSKEQDDHAYNLDNLFNANSSFKGTDVEEKMRKESKSVDWSRESLLREQESDSEVKQLKERIARGVKEEDLFEVKEGVLVKKSVKGVKGECMTNERVVVPFKFRSIILQRGHDDIFAGHAGISKTYQRISKHFYWPKLKSDVVKYCKTCSICQVVGKPNEVLPKAPLSPIPSIGKPFDHIIMDVVGPLPRSRSGHEFILTILDRVSRYPEAFPLRSIKSPVIVNCLLEYFSRFGLPKTIQTDQGTNFTSNYFKTRMKELGVIHKISSAYHPESQGAIERFHQTLKHMIKKYCIDKSYNWNTDLPMLLFAIRSQVNDSLGFSPFEVIFGHSVRGPLDIVKESWLTNNEDVSIADWVDSSRSKIESVRELASQQLEHKQIKMKLSFDTKAKQRKFKIGDLVLVLLPVVSNQLESKFAGPYSVVKVVSNTNYIISTPDRRKKQWLCHINMLKPYLVKEVKPVLAVVDKACDDDDKDKCNSESVVTSNSSILNNLDDKLNHLPVEQKEPLKQLIYSFKDLFRDYPGRTSLMAHDVIIENSPPIKQHPYRLNPQKNKIVEQEVEYMLRHNLIKPSTSPWASPVVLVSKGNGQHRLCFDYRKVNQVTRTDSYPLPRMDDCIDQIGSAQYITKFDFVKGYWQIPLSERAQSISAFVTSSGLYECLVMPFGMKNAALTFQRLMNELTRNINNCVVYIDDVVLYNNDWEEHIQQISDFFGIIREAGLVINLDKSNFSQASVTYLGHVVGYGKVTPKSSNIEAILNFPVPCNRKQVMQFLGLAGYYRKFVRNFSDIANPLTNLLKKDVKFSWDKSCDVAFGKLKSVLINKPILQSPDFTKPFNLSIDASDTGVGAVLSQLDENDNNLPVAFFSKKLTPYQKSYSTVEKETLSLLLAIDHFEIYLTSNVGPIIVNTDHNPLTFLHRFKHKNQRLTRWSLLLQEYDLQIKHIKGKDNIIPDVLSRV